MMKQIELFVALALHPFSQPLLLLLGPPQVIKKGHYFFQLKETAGL